MLIVYSTLEQIAEHGSKAFYEGEIGMHPIPYQKSGSNHSSQLHHQRYPGSKRNHDHERSEKLPGLHP
jgi:hypothetical protein